MHGVRKAAEREGWRWPPCCEQGWSVLQHCRAVLVLPSICSKSTLVEPPWLPHPPCRWVDEYGHVVGDTHEPEPNADRSSAGRKRGAGSSEGGGKRQKRSTVELLGGAGGGGGHDSSASGSDCLQPLHAAPQVHAQAQAALPAAAASLAAGSAGAGTEDAVPMEAAAGAANSEPAVLRQQAGTAGLGLLPGQVGGPADKVLDAYAPFNLASQPPWDLPPISVGSLPAPQLNIVGLRVNPKLSSLLPPPAQVCEVHRAPCRCLPSPCTCPTACSSAASAIVPCLLRRLQRWPAFPACLPACLHASCVCIPAHFAAGGPTA